MPLSANLFRQECTILTQVKRAKNQNNVATERFIPKWFCTVTSLSHNFQVFWVQFRSEVMFISKDPQCSDRRFCIHEFFSHGRFCIYLVGCDSLQTKNEKKN